MSRRTEARTGLWVLVDQIASSGTSFGASALAAGLLSAGDFGAWSIAFTVYVLLLSSLRTWCGDTLLLLLPLGDAPGRATAGALGFALSAGCLAGTIIFVIGTIPEGTTGSALRALGLCLPGVLLQDATRMSALALRNAQAALLNDGLWLVLTVVALMTLRLTNTASTSLAVLAWGLPAYVAALLGLHQLRSVPELPRVADWINRTRPLSVLISAEWLVFILGSLLMLQVVLSLNGEVEAVGSVRGAQVLMGPVVVLFAASTTFSLPLMVRAIHAGGSAVKLGIRQAAVNAAAVLVWFVVASVIPRNAGVRVFGATWDPAQDRLRPIALALLFAGIGAGAISVLRSSERIASSVSANSLIAFLVCGSTVVAAANFSAETSVWAFAVASALAPTILWLIVLRAVEQRDSQFRGTAGLT